MRTVVLFPLGEFIVIEPYVIYKAIYNDSFLDKIYIPSIYVTDNKGAPVPIGVSQQVSSDPYIGLLFLLFT